MSIPPCTLLHHRPKAPKDLPTHLLNSTLAQTLEYYRQYGYYPSPQVRQALQRLNGAKPSVFAHLNALFGDRTLASLSPSNMAFHILEHPETLWLRHFVIYMHRHHPFTSVIWLHDGVWLSPPPAADPLAAANTYAAMQIHLPPLDFTYTPLRAQYETVFSDIMRGSPPPARAPIPRSNLCSTFERGTAS